MRMNSVKSSNVSQVGYDADGHRLGVIFNGGAEYHYHGVPQEVYDKVVSAESVGTAIEKLVKPHYAVAKVEKKEKQ